MKIAISCKDMDLAGEVDPRFGRAKGFIILDTETDTFSCVDNEQNLQATQGAGIQAAQNVSEQGVEAVITGHCGPKAFRALEAAGIKVYAGAQGTVADAVSKWKTGDIAEAHSADVEGHW